jgi:hypothetical protein
MVIRCALPPQLAVVTLLALSFVVESDWLEVGPWCPGPYGLGMPSTAARPPMTRSTPGTSPGVSTGARGFGRMSIPRRGGRRGTCSSGGCLACAPGL